MQRVFEEFVQRLFESVDETDLREALASAAAEFDLQQFAFLTLPGSSSATLRLNGRTLPGIPLRAAQSSQRAVPIATQGR